MVMNFMTSISKALREGWQNPFLRIVVIITLNSQLLTLNSQAQTIREAFKAMPDSLMPYLTANNRLDLMDFMDAKMKATVTNLLEGQTEMTFLSDDSLSIRMSDALTIEMKTQKVDTITVATLKRIYNTREGERQAVLTRYDTRTWKELTPATVIESTLPKFDEKVTPNSKLSTLNSQL